MEKRLELTVTEPSTVRRFLMRHPGFTRRQLSRLKFRDRGLLRNGKPVRIVDPVVPGDVLSIWLHESPKTPVRPLPFPVLYEDDLLLVIDKPAGQVVHPSPGHETDSVQTILESCRGHELYLRGRLDKDTSGILVFAKADWVPSMIRMEKIYLAVCEGKPETCLIDSPLRLQDRKMVPDPAGKSARTHIRKLRAVPEGTLVSVTIEHGRMHQIRAHMAAAGHPLKGDPVYGHGTEATRTLLHCASLRLIHPVTKEIVVCSACLPQDFIAACGVSSE